MKRALLLLVFIGTGYLAFSQNSYTRRRIADTYAYSFDGVNDRITIPNSDSLNLERTDPFSIEAWLNIPTSGGTQYIYNKIEFTSVSRGISLYISNGVLWVNIQSTTSNKIQFLLQDSSGYVLLFNSHTPYSKWFHFALTYDGSSDINGCKVYFNGKQYPATYIIFSNNLTGTIQTTASANIGGITSNYSQYKQSVTRIFRKALSAAEVATLYNNGVVNYRHGISRCVFDMQVRNDVFASNYTVIDSALGNNGTTTGMLAAQKERVDSMEGMHAITAIQSYTGNSLYYNTFGTAGTGLDNNSTGMTYSPLTDRFRTPIVYDFSNNQTYVGFSKRPGIGYDKQGRLIKILHDGKIVTPSGGTGYSFSGRTDAHLTPGITITPDNEILLAREEQHSAATLYIEKSTGKSQAALSPYSTVSNTGSYPQLTRIGSNVFLWLREGLEYDNISKSSNNGLTWISNSVLTTTGGGSTQRPYSMCIYDSTKLRYMVTMFKDNISKFTDNFYVESTDGITFYNASHSFSKNIVSSGAITRAEMFANCLALTTASDTMDIMCKAVVVTPTGKIVSLVAADTTHYNVLYWNGSSWQTKSLNIPNWFPTGYGLTGKGRVDFFVLYPYSDSSFVFWRIETRGGYDVIVEYRTTDFFDTIDAGTIVSATNVNHQQINGTFNINDARKIVITANALYSTENKLFIYEFTP